MPEDIDIDEPKTFTLEGREIFAVGVHNGDRYTIEDLDDIVDNFNLLSDLIKPPLKLGHNDKQEKEILRDGQPALGWIENVRRMGEKLVADFIQVPATVYATIMSGRYKRVSPEIVYKLKSQDKTFTNVLWAVALLGADVPAVKNLLDIDKSVGALLSTDTKAGYEFDSLRTYDMKMDNGVIQTNEQGGNMGELEKAQADSKKYADERDTEKEARVKLEGELKTYKEKETKRLEDEEKVGRLATVSDVKKYCEEQVKTGKMLPATRDSILVAVEDGKRAYSHEDKAVFIPFEILKGYADTVEKVFVKKGEEGSAENKKNYASAKDEIHAKTEAMVVEHKMDYADAMSQVLSANPELAKASLEEEEEAK